MGVAVGVVVDDAVGVLVGEEVGEGDVVGVGVSDGVEEGEILGVILAVFDIKVQAKYSLLVDTNK